MVRIDAARFAVESRLGRVVSPRDRAAIRDALAELAGAGVKITRLGRGLAVGSQIEYASVGMIEAAIRGRGPA